MIERIVNGVRITVEGRKVTMEKSGHTESFLTDPQDDCRQAIREMIAEEAEKQPGKPS